MVYINNHNIIFALKNIKMSYNIIHGDFKT